MVKVHSTKILKNTVKTKPKDLQTKISLNIFYFILSLLLSNKSILENYFPYGPAIISFVPYSNIMLTAVGSIVSYLISKDLTFSIKYIAATISICTVRWALKDLKLHNYKLYSPILCSFVLFLTSIPVYTNSGFASFLLINNLIEALLSFICSYFLKESIFYFLNYFLTKNTISSHLIKSPKELLTFCVSAFSVTLTLSNTNFVPISLGKVLAIFILLLITKTSGLLGTSIGVITFEFIFSLKFIEKSNTLNYYYGLILSSAAMFFSSLFSKLSKFKISVLYILLNLILKLIFISTLGYKEIISSLYESIFAAVLFMLVPKSIEKDLINLTFLEKPKSINFYNIQNYLSSKLKFLAESFFNIGSSVNIVSSKDLKKQSKENLVKTKVKEKFCTNCKLNTFCWNLRKEETEISFTHLINNTKSPEKICSKNILKERCKNFENIKNQIDILKKEQNIKLSVNRRLNEMKDFMVEQFKDIGNVLENTSLNIENNFNFRNDVSDRIVDLLNKNGIKPLYVFCKETKSKKMLLEISINLKDEEKFNNLNLSKILNREYNKNFKELLENRLLNNTINYIITEKPMYRAEISVSQHICKDGLFCGDNYKYFKTEDGKLVIVLSDGMGTGTRAAIEGIMACEIISALIKCNLNFNLALKIANTSLLMNPSEESLVALDIVCIDLFTGETKFIKAGAPVTFIKSNKEVKILNEKSLPIGILKDINCSLKKTILFNEDKVLIMSDGAIYPKHDWITNTLNNWETENSKEITDFIVNKSLEYRGGKEDDDITVLALKLVKEI